MEYDMIKTNAGKIINGVREHESIGDLAAMYFKYIPNSPSDTNVFHEVLLTLSAINIGKELDIDLLFDLFAEVNLGLPRLLPSKDVWRFCLTLDNRLLLERLLEKGYNLSSDGNIVRHAVYSNRLDIAELLLKYGYKAPETLTMFAVSNQLSWDPLRVQFLLDHGTVFTIDEKERAVLNILKDEKLWNIVKQKERKN